MHSDKIIDNRKITKPQLSNVFMFFVYTVIIFIAEIMLIPQGNLKMSTTRCIHEICCVVYCNNENTAKYKKINAAKRQLNTPTGSPRMCCGDGS